MKDILFFIKRVFGYALQRWKLFFVIGFSGGVVGFIYASFQDPIYEARLTFILNENEPTSSFSLSSLAGLAGLGGGSAGNVSEDKLIFIANSRNLIGSTLLNETLIGGQKKLLANFYLEYYNLIPGFKSDTTLINFTGFTHLTLEQLNYQENKVMDKIVKTLFDGKSFTIDAKKKSGIVAQGAGIIELKFKSVSEEFSLLFIERLYDNLSKYYINKAVQRQLRNYNLIKARTDSIKEVLFNKEDYGAEMLDKNVRVIRMKGRVDMERTRRDVELLSLMYGEVMKNQEIAKFALDNQTPYFQTIDKPTYPLFIKKMSRMLAAILGAVLLSFVVFIWLIAKDYRLIFSPAMKING
ncbi:MAG: hypothetical protein H7296_15550 [Bacteroidia bacterium]|nr:hypothetical protein [Bacteroidia bacterium]